MNCVCRNATSCGKIKFASSKILDQLALMVVMAERFLQYHENRAIELALTKNPTVATKSFLWYMPSMIQHFIPTFNIQWTLKMPRRPCNSLTWRSKPLKGNMWHQSTEKRHQQRPSETSFWSQSKDTQGYFHRFPLQSIRHLPTNPTWRKSRFSDQMFHWK